MKYRVSVRSKCVHAHDEDRCSAVVIRNCNKNVCCLYCRSYWACYPSDYRLCSKIKQEDKLVQMILYSEWTKWIKAELKKDGVRSKQIKEKIDRELQENNI